MARKSEDLRLTIPTDIWNNSKLGKCDSSSLGFFITDDSRVAIMNLDVGKDNNYDYIGKCYIEGTKHRFHIPKNVDTYLGEGDEYYFSVYLLSDRIYLYKLDRSICQARQLLQIKKLLASL